MKITGSRPGGAAGPTGAQAYSSIQRSTGAKNAAPAKLSTDVLNVLGIPETEFTPAVRDAIMNLMGEVDRLREELARTKQRLESVQAVADQDGLLPILNRRAFVREMSRILSFGERYDLSASLVYFDLDGLKAINDTFGHASGDAVLKKVAATLTENVRESDVVGRLGGDEFGVILAKADREQAEKKARQLAEKLASAPLLWQNQSIQISVAFGIHPLKKGDAPDAAMANADQAMYALKRARSDKKE